MPLTEALKSDSDFFFKTQLNFIIIYFSFWEGRGGCEMGPGRRRSPASIRGEPAANGRGGSQTPARGGGTEEERAGAPAAEGVNAPEAAAARGSPEVAATTAAATAGADEGEA